MILPPAAMIRPSGSTGTFAEGGLAATRLIQHHAVDRLITMMALLGHATTPQQDLFALDQVVLDAVRELVARVQHAD